METQLIAKYQADIAGLEAAVGKVQAVAAETQKAFQKSNKGIEESAKKVNSAFEKLGENGRRQLQKIGDTQRVQAGFVALGAAGSKQLDLITGKSQEAGNALASIPAKTEEAAKKALGPTVNLKKALGDAGQGARRLGVLIGGVFGDLIFYGGEALSAIKGIASSLVRLLGTGGLITAGFAAATAAGGYFISRLREAAIQARVTKGSMEELAESIKKLSQEQKDTRKSLAGQQIDVEGTKGKIDELKALVANLEKAGIKSQIPELNAQIRDLEAVVAGANVEIAATEQKLSKLGQTLAEKRLAEITEKLSIALLKAEKAYRTGGEELDYLNEQYDAYAQAVGEALEVEGLEESSIADLRKSMRSLSDLIEKATQKYRDLALAKEDASLPTGSFSPVEQPQGLIAAQFGSQFNLPQKESVDELTAAFERMMETVQTTGEAIAATIGDVFRTLTDGLAAAFVALVTQMGDAQQILAGVFAQIAQMIIAKIIEVFIIEAAIEKTKIILKSISAHAGIPFIGIALGIAAAGAAIAAARGLAGSEGGRAFAEGGVVTGPVMGLIGEAGPEVVLPLRNSTLEKFGLGGNREFEIHNYLTLDGKVAAKSVTRHQPGVLRRKLGPIF